MKIKHLILLTTAAVAASSLSSCKEEPYIITAEEEYTRNFIKEFGLIDPKQDWNLAEGSTVTVKVGSTPAEVKAYMKVDNTYYLVADLKDVAGDVKIPFDMPEGTTDIMVKINGTRYYTTPGGTVGPNNPASRGLAAGGDYGEVKVKIERNPYGRRLNLLPEVMLQAIKKLPENDDHVESWSETNFDIVTDNFHATASTFYIFPEYWNTQRFKSNAIGIYYYVDENTSGAEKVEVTQNNEVVATYYIKRIPIIDGGINQFLKGYKSGVGNWNCYYDEIPENLLQRTGDTLIKYWPDEYKWADGTETPASTSFPFSEGDLIWKYTEKLYYPEGATELRWRKISDTRLGDCDPDLTTRQRLSDKMPDDYLLATLEDGGSWFGKPTLESVVSTQNAAHNTAVNDIENDHTNDYEGFYSEGIKVTFDKPITFGFYLAADYEGEGTRYFYSENKLNKRIQKLNDDGESEWRSPSYAATFTNGTDTEGNDKRYLCFEDWKDDNWDLNDMIFRLYGFDTIRSENPDNLPNDPDSKITDEDNTDPTPPTVTITETDTPYNWLLAVEDLGATDDFDFNDIIVGITSVTVKVVGDLTTTTNHVIDSDKSSDGLYKKVTFTALAAGGTLPAYVYYGDTQLYPDGHADRAEWHKWFDNGNLSTGTMINTGSPLGKDNQKGASCTLYFGIDSDGKSSFSFEKLGEGPIIGAKDSGLKIGIDKSGQMSYSSELIDTDYFTKGDDGYFIKPSDPGTAPQMFLIPDKWDGGGKWQWPTERTHIQNSYDRFGDWVGDPSVTDWYKATGKGVCRPVPSK